MAVGALESNAIGILPGPYSHTMPMLQGRAKTSEAWALGAVLIRDTGEIAEAAADPVANVIGIAAEALTSAAANKLVLYYPWLPGTVWEATLEDETNTDHALVESNIFTDYGLQVDTGGIWYVDENETTNTSVVILAPKNDSDIVNATVRARVYFTPILDVMTVDT